MPTVKKKPQAKNPGPEALDSHNKLSKGNNFPRQRRKPQDLCTWVVTKKMSGLLS